jgi:hypothetical protein
LANRRSAQTSATPSPDTITNPAGLVGDGTTGIAPGRVGVTVRVSVTVPVGVLVAVLLGVPLAEAVCVTVPVLVVVKVLVAVPTGADVRVAVAVFVAEAEAVGTPVEVGVEVLTGVRVLVETGVLVETDVRVSVGVFAGVFVGPPTVTCPFVSGLQAVSFSEQPPGISGVPAKVSALAPGATPLKVISSRAPLPATAVTQANVAMTVPDVVRLGVTKQLPAGVASSAPAATPVGMTIVGS